MSNVHVPPAGGQSLPSSSPSSSLSSPHKVDKAVGEPVDLPPQFAIRSDGVVLLCTAEAEATGRDLTGRTLWVAIELTSAEREDLRERAYDVEQAAASKLTARLPKKPSGTA